MTQKASNVIVDVAEEMKSRWMALQEQINLHKARILEIDSQRNNTENELDRVRNSLKELMGRYKEMSQWIERFTGNFPGMQQAKNEITPADPREEIKKKEEAELKPHNLV